MGLKYRLWRPFQALLGVVANIIARRTSEVRVARGLQVVLLGPSIGSESHLLRLENALSLIDHHSPWILQRARREGTALFLIPSGRAGVMPGVSAIKLPSKDLVELPTDWLALRIVFHLTHHRVDRIRKRGVTDFRAIRLVIERQLAFARRLPNGIPLVEELTRGWDAGQYNSSRQRTLDAEAMKAQGVPRWLIKTVLFFHE